MGERAAFDKLKKFSKMFPLLGRHGSSRNDSLNSEDSQKSYKWGWRRIADCTAGDKNPLNR